METFKEFERYIAHLSEGLGHADRHSGLKCYCTGLMLPLARQSVEPMGAITEPRRGRAPPPARHPYLAQAGCSAPQAPPRRGARGAGSPTRPLSAVGAAAGGRASAPPASRAPPRSGSTAVGPARPRSE